MLTRCFSCRALRFRLLPRRGPPFRCLPAGRAVPVRSRRAGLADFDSGLRTVECTKRAAVFGLWGAWSLFGPQLFADLVDVTFDLGRLFHNKLCAAPDFTPLHEPQCNIVVFRYVPERLRNAPLDELGRFQMDLRRRIIESGRFYIVSTQIDGVGALRVTIINPLTAPDDLDDLLETIRKAC